MALTLISCAGGTLVLPARASLLCDRGDGGNLVVHPPRTVWERSQLSVEELAAWSFLVSACGEAMLSALPQLEGGCINYWEAGNWALNEAAEPKGPKRARDHRRVHLHLIGRSRFSTSSRMSWGESPQFPCYAERHEWARDYTRLSAAECQAIVARARRTLSTKFGFPADAFASSAACPNCAYPVVGPCSECAH
jgi:hypothetical protein